MTDPHQRLCQMIRPRLLVRAARFGLEDYRRPPAVQRLIARAGARTQHEIVSALFEAEAAMDQRRRAGEGDYRVARHVELLIALMSEARLLPPAAQPRAAALALAPRPRPKPAARSGQVKASGISALRRAT